MKYLSVYVYKWSLGDCSAGGITSNNNQVAVPHESGNLSSEAPSLLHIPAVEITEFKGRQIARPANDNRWLMFGGSFIWCSDSRFREKYGQHPIPVFDRYEKEEN